MYKVMITTLDSGDEGFCIESDCKTQKSAWDYWEGMRDDYPEMINVWVENQTITDEFGAEAAANVMGIGDDSY